MGCLLENPIYLSPALKRRMKKGGSMGRAGKTAGIVVFSTIAALLLASATEAEEGQEAPLSAEDEGVIEEDVIEEVVDAIVVLQPATDSPRATKLARVFVEAGQTTEVDPLLLVAIAMRESSLREDVERLERFGSRGERGLMQAHGAALRLRPERCTSDLEGAWCQVMTGARWLAYVRDRCPGSPWRWVAAYGMSRCPTEQQAGMDASTRRARTLYARVGGDRWP